MTATLTLAAPVAQWVDVCPLGRLVPDRGVCALVGGRQVAVFLLADGGLAAVDNRDPFSGANVLSRGLVGCTGGEPKVVSPMYKQSFSLETGRCFEDDLVSVRTHPVRVECGMVQVGLC